jgi:hypothetical protein
MAERSKPADAPLYGYVLETQNELVGVLLLLFTGEHEERAVFNVSSWYVRPAFRGFATMLVTTAMRRKDAVYMNTSPVAHSLPVLEVLGFRPLSLGQFVSVPLFSTTPKAASVRVVGPDDGPAEWPRLADFDLLRAHAALGCVCLVCEIDGRTSAFIFVRRRIRYAPLGVAQMIWRSETADFAACAGPIGRALALRGMLLVISDANGPVPGLIGRYVPGKAPKYYRGPAKPRINDLAFTETVIFGP